MRASHIKTFRGHGSFISSNLVGETHVPRNAPGTPQANARFRPPRTHARSADEADGSEESEGACARSAGSGRAAPVWAESSVRPGRSKGSGEARARANGVMGPGEREVP